MKFLLFSKIEFEVSDPLALIECYCFQSDFYANYDILPDRNVEDVNAIGARISKRQLDECARVVDGTRNARIFGYNERGLNKFLDLDDETISWLVRETLMPVFSQLMAIDGIKLSKASKVLHTVYPTIVPMIDGMLQREYHRYRQAINRPWIEHNHAEILIDYYRNLKEETNRANLAYVFERVSENGLRLTKMRVFDILWWSYLKAKGLGGKNHIDWYTTK